MEISDFRAVNQPPSPAGFRMIAKFSLDVTPDFRIYDCQAVQAPDGRLAIYPPRADSSTIAAIAPAAREAISEKVIEVMNRENHDKRAA